MVTVDIGQALRDHNWHTGEPESTFKSYKLAFTVYIETRFCLKTSAACAFTRIGLFQHLFSKLQ